MEKIAIIGIGCRFPGAENPESFWQLLANKIDAVREIPSRPFDLNMLDYHPIVPTTGKTKRLWGGFLPKVEYFDPSFFQISPIEAERIDPQQRLFLEVAWESLENAGIVPSSELSGSKTGVFVGVYNYDYGLVLSREYSQINAYNAIGNNLSIIANRLSYFLNLRGPSLVIDTACSSSLVALHYACQSLLTGESNLCLAAGVNLILSPERTISLSHAQMIAADGRCKTFDAAADGYVQGEGCGVVVLKRLADAIRDGDNIQAIIRGSAVNQNGLSNGLVAPNGPSQQAVIRQALANAGVEPAQISYVETQGTGTPMGDSIEVNALKAVLMEGREANQPCWIGSVKTNIGHLEGAAGIAGLIKVVLSLQQGEIPPHLHLKKLNPFIKIQNTPIQIPTELQQWPATEQPRLAGVSAFSFGGTNAHVVLEEAPSEIQNSKCIIQNLPERYYHLLTLSAKTETALQALASRYQNHLETHPNQALADICFTANRGRSHFDYRLAVVVDSKEQLIKQLAAFAVGKETTGLTIAQVMSKKRPKIAFLFSGQGFEYVNMGRQLYDTQPIFRKALEECDRILRFYLEHSLLEVLYTSETADHVSSLLEQTVYIEPALFALEYALYQLWKSWGIEPDVVMGHDVGEYIAACVAGVFSLEDALKLIAHRSTSPSMQPKVAEEISYSQPQIQIIVNGKVADSEITTPEYWLQHGQSSVQIADSLATLQQLGMAAFVEIGPKSNLLAMAKQYLPEDAGLWLPSLNADIPDWQQLLESLAQLYVRGVAVNWSGFDQDYPRSKVILPTYPFERQRYWIDKSKSLGQKTSFFQSAGEIEGLTLKRTSNLTQHLDFLYQFQQTPIESRESLVKALLQEQIALGLGLKISQVDVSASLKNFGFDSLIAVELRNRIINKLGVDISMVKFLENPTIENLTTEVLTQLPTTDNSQTIVASSEKLPLELVPLQMQGSKPPLFFAHPLAGVIFPYYELATLIDNERPFYGLQSVGLLNQDEPLTSVEEMASVYIEALKKVQPSGPYYLGGWSLGAYIAWEMAVQLTQAKEEVAFLGIVDIPPPAIGKIANLKLLAKFIFTQVLLHVWPDVYDFLGIEKSSATQKQPQNLSLLSIKILQFLKKIVYRIPAAARLLLVLQANTKAMNSYIPSFYGGKITLLRTDKPMGSSFDEPTLGWNKFAKTEIEVHLFPGNHFTLLRQPHVHTLSQQLKSFLDKVDIESSSVIS